MGEIIMFAAGVAVGVIFDQAITRAWRLFFRKDPPASDAPTNASPK